MEDNQVVEIENTAVEITNSDFKIIPNSMDNDPEEMIEYCLEGATNITQPVKNDGDHDTFSGDEGMEKVLTTLETIQTDGDQDDDEPYSTYEIEDLPASDQLDDTSSSNKEDTLSASEIARIQLEGLARQKVGRPKKSQVTVLDGKGNVSSDTASSILNSPTSENNSPNGPVSSSRPIGRTSPLVSSILTKEEVEAEVCKAVLIPVNELSTVSVNDHDSMLENQVSLLTESPNMGTIEIPRELITGNTFASPIYVPNTSKSIQNEDLLAILEGNDDSFEEKKTESIISPEDEKVIAMKQIMSLPANPRGRRPNPKTKKLNKAKANDLVNSLVSDWSDNDSGSKKEESENEIEKPKQKNVKTPKSSKPAVINVQIDNDRSERRSRVIKKKIIWDPDAPETAFSYASLVQSTSKKPKLVQQKDKESEESNDLRKRKSDSTSPANAKKKKVSEIDKLLADEGAINILNSLKHENNNADLSDTESTMSEKIPNKRMARKVNVEANDVSSMRQNESTKPDTTNQKSPRKPKATTVATKKEPKKRGPNKSASSSWDYIYNDTLGQRGDDSMIIRRRSNSSYSSTTSLSRLSIEAPAIENDKTVDANEKAFEFARPTMKKNAVPETIPQKQLILSDLRGKVDKKGNVSKVDGENTVRRSSRAVVTEVIELNNIKVISDPPSKKQEISSNKRKAADKSNDSSTYKEITVTTMKNSAHIELAPTSGKLQNSFSVQMMEEVTKALKDLSTNSTIKAVLISSCSSSFCSGIDYSNLVQGTVDKRKQSATDLSLTLINFITSIATFKKILIAGVHGHTVGIGVTILPLFDVIFASNKSTFSTPYAKIGQVPENGTIFAKTNKLSHQMKVDLLYLNETIKAANALQFGLVTRVFNSDVFETEIIQQTEQVALQSSQSMEATKSLTHFDIIDNIDTDLANEQKLLIQHWASTECQDKFKHFLLKEKW